MMTEKRFANLKNYTAFFEATVYDDSNMNSRTEYGAIPAETFTEAAAMLEDYYGNDLVKFSIELVEGGVLLFTKEVFDELKNSFLF